MFIRQKSFRQLIKGAYTGAGLTVGRRGSRIFFEGGYWIIDVERVALPNKALAAVIELTGELPADGEVFKATKAGNQYEIAGNSYWDIEAQAEDADVLYKVTDLVLQSNRSNQVLQNEYKKVQLINEMFIEAIAPAEMNFEYESSIEGPMARSEEAKMVYWRSKACVLAACLVNIDDEKKKLFLEYLQGVELQGSCRL